MTRRYKTSYRSSRGVRRFRVSFGATPQNITTPKTCTICGGKVEESPMLRGVCYTCYRKTVDAVMQVVAAELVTREIAGSHKTMNTMPEVEHPTYDQLIRGAKFTDEHRTENREWWNFYYSDEEVRKRQAALK